MKFWNLFCFLLMLFCQLSKSLDVSLTLSIPPRKRECLHQAMTEGVQYEVEYQVLMMKKGRMKNNWSCLKSGPAQKNPAASALLPAKPGRML